MMETLPELLQLLAALAAAAAVTALALGAWEAYQVIYKRYLAQLGTDAGLIAAGAPEEGPGTLAALRGTVVAFLAAVNERWVPDRYLERIEIALRKAGKPLELKGTEIVAFIELSALCSLCAGIVLYFWLGLSVMTWICFALLAVLAFFPLIWLRDKVKYRHHLITRALPYNLDLLTLSVEAGLDFAAALGKVVEKGRKGPLADELNITLKELKLGKTREEALRNLGGRVDLPTLTSFVHALIQADKMGTPLGKILRILSTQMRIERTQRAEKLANEAPVKLLLPLIGFIFPTIFIMLFGPIAYQVFFGGNF
jgi:tight adherence protein C